MDPRVERSKAAVVEASRSLMLESGAGSVTIDAIVQRTGVARSTIYRHFPTVTDVLRAGIESLFEESTHPAQPAGDAAQPGGSVETLRQQVLSYLLDLAEDLLTSNWAKALPGLLESVTRDASLEHHRQELVNARSEPLAQLLRQAQNIGLLPAEKEAEDVVSALVGPLFYRRFVSGEPITEQLCHSLVDAYLPRSRSGSPIAP